MAIQNVSFVFFAWLAVLCTYVVCDGQFMLAHVPDYIKIHSDAGAIEASDIPQLYSLALGFSSSKPVSWHGMSSGNLFQRPKAGVLVTVEEVEGSDALKPSALKSVPITNVKAGSLSLDTVQENIRNMYGEGRPVSVELSAGAEFVRSPGEFPSLFEGLPPLRLDRMMPLLTGSTSVILDLSPTTLNLTHQSDVVFFSELQIMKEVLLKLKTNGEVVKDNVPDIYAFELSGYRLLQSEYGLGSAQVTDAQNVLADFLQQWGHEMITLYGDDLFMGVATVPMEAFQHRQGRSLMQSPGEITTATMESTTLKPVTTVQPATTSAPVPSGNVTPSSLNVAPYYSPDYPVFFNIFLWMTIVLIITVYVIAYMLGSMDPGDSIIYRMTSQRIKMD